MDTSINTGNTGKLYAWAYALLVIPAYLVLRYFELINPTTSIVNAAFLTLISTVIPALVVTALVLVVRTFILKK